MRKIICLEENGFCYGVKNAIKIATTVAMNNSIPKPIYLLGNLVHNEHVKNALLSMGIIIMEGNSRLEMITKISYGTVIFSAHGVSDKVLTIAKEKNLTIIDATCPYVKKTFTKMKEIVNDGYDVIFIGKDSHPETEAALSISTKIHLYDDKINNITNNKVALCHQTTMSSFDIKIKYDELLKKIPNIKKLDMICNITEIRQKRIISLRNNLLNGDSCIIVIGDRSSNNSLKLYEMACHINKDVAIFASSISDINLSNIKKYKNIYLISGTSTPIAIVKEIEDILNNLDNEHNINHLSKLRDIDYLKI